MSCNSKTNQLEKFVTEKWQMTSTLLTSIKRQTKVFCRVALPVFQAVLTLLLALNPNRTYSTLISLSLMLSECLRIKST